MTQQPGWWPDEPAASGQPSPATAPPPAADPTALHSGPVSPWAHSGYLPPVDPVPAPTPPHGELVSTPGPSLGDAGSASGPPPGPGGYAAARPAVAAPPRDGRWKPSRVEPVAGTGYGVVHLEVAPVTSGLAVGALIAGIAAVFVGVLVLCLGAAGASGGWGAWVAGAFTVLGAVAGGGGVGLGLAALRQIRRSGRPGMVRFTGRGSALGGTWCGGIGLGICLLSLALVLVLQLA